MSEGEQASIRLGPDPDPLDGLWPVPIRGVHLRAAERELDRAADLAGRHRCQRDMRPSGALAAETAADKGADDPDLLGLEAEQGGECPL